MMILWKLSFQNKSEPGKLKSQTENARNFYFDGLFVEKLTHYLNIGEKAA